jgi:REP element-mobilizing transposase RayT
MARKLRIQYPGAFYHIIVRGNQRQDIFRDEADRHEYIKRLQRYKEKYGFLLYAFVLMGNHVHLLIETPSEPISRIMQALNFTYTQYFNRKYGTVGHLFQGRYKSYLCDREAYLLTLVRYIHMNPVRAGLTDGPDGYEWSSHQDYMSGSRGVVDTEGVLRLFGERRGIARRRYRQFIAESTGSGEEMVYQVTGQQIIGDEGFVVHVAEKLKGSERPVKKKAIAGIARALEVASGYSMQELASSRRGATLRTARGVLVAIARGMGYTLKEIGAELGRDISVLTRLGAESQSDEGQRLMKRVLKNIDA